MPRPYNCGARDPVLTGVPMGHRDIISSPFLTRKGDRGMVETSWPPLTGQPGQHHDERVEFRREGWLCSCHMKNWLFIALAAATTMPAIALRFTHFTDSAPLVAIIFGVAMLGAAFLLAWATEVAQLDIPRSLAVAVLALIAILPEYSVDMVFAWKAAHNPDFAHYAVANMTGANRLLVGLGWSLVVLLFWLRGRGKEVVLEQGQSVELGFLLLATVWAFVIVGRSLLLGGSLTLWDSAVLVSLFAAYLWVSSRAEVEEPDLYGPAATIGRFGKTPRRVFTAGMLLFSAAVILGSAEPFAESLVASGEQLGIDEFILVQWLAPLASEAPEITVATIFAIRGAGAMALGTLVSSLVNQWTLLVGTLAVVYSISAGSVSALPMDARQQTEVWLTAAQCLFAVVLLASLRLSWRGALVLFVLFTSQLFFPDPQIRHYFSIGYLGLALGLLLFNRSLRRSAFGLLPRALGEIRGQRQLKA